MERLETEADLKAAVAHLVAIEPRFVMILEQHGLPSLRQMEPGLKSLLRIVTDQLISLQAGAAIWSRLEARLGAFEEQDVLRCPEDELMSLGLSGAKARTFHAAAKFYCDLDPMMLAGLGDREGRLLGRDALDFNVILALAEIVAGVGDADAHGGVSDRITPVDFVPRLVG